MIYLSINKKKNKVNLIENLQIELDGVTLLYNKVAAVGEVEVKANRFEPGKNPEKYVED